MRNGQNNNNKQRMRGRNNNNNNNNNRKGQNPMTRVYESNGPDVKIRGTASHVAEKYMQLARDSQTSGDPVAAENYFQHAEHYLRMIAAVQEQFRQQNPFYREGEPSRDGAYEDGDEEGSDGNGFRPNEGQFQPREQQPQPFQPRDPQPQHNREPHHNREPRQNREPRYENRDGFQANRPQPPAPVVGDENIDRLPAFVTGGATAQPPAPVQNGANGQVGFDAAADRFPLHRRRRRRHGPRPEMGGGPGDGEQASAPQPPDGSSVD